MKSIRLNYDNSGRLPAHDLAYIDANIAVINSITDIANATEPHVVEGYMLLVVRKGSSVMEIHGKKVEIGPGDALVCTPGIVIENRMVSEKIDIFGCFVDTAFAQQSMRELNFSYYGTETNYGRVHLDDTDITALEQYHQLLARMLHKETSRLSNMAAYHLLHTAALDLYMMFQKDNTRHIDIISTYSAAEQIFQRFLVILRSQDSTVRSVNEVATQLNISPKYFSAICKRITGKTALEIINEELLNRANILLRDPKENIKQISSRLGFTNQSHFGTFMRRHTGKSPQQIRTGK